MFTVIYSVVYVSEGAGESSVESLNVEMSQWKVQRRAAWRV